jgi:ketosteroid isomerase-like protein
MREAYQTYFSTVQALRFDFADLDIDVAGDKALATFTRRDDFTDTLHFEVRVSSIVSKQGGQWRIRGLKKAS